MTLMAQIVIALLIFYAVITWGRDVLGVLIDLLFVISAPFHHWFEGDK